MAELRPFDTLNEARDKKVTVELKNEKQYAGKLKAFDIYINLVLENAEEIENQQTKRKLGIVFVRGDTIRLITT